MERSWEGKRSRVLDRGVPGKWGSARRKHGSFDGAGTGWKDEEVGGERGVGSGGLGGDELGDGRGEEGGGIKDFAIGDTLQLWSSLRH